MEFLPHTCSMVFSSHDKLIVAFLIGCCVLGCVKHSSREQPPTADAFDVQIQYTEDQIEISPSIRNHYGAYFIEDSSFIPLLKCIDGIDYRIYVGLPVTDNLARLKLQSLSRIPGLPITQVYAPNAYYYVQANIRDLFVTEFFIIKDSAPIYLRCETHNRNQLADQHSLQALMKRIGAYHYSPLHATKYPTNILSE